MYICLSLIVDLGFQPRLIEKFVYDIPTGSNKNYFMYIPRKTLIELLPFLQLGLSYTSVNRKYIYGANLGMAKTVFPIVWRLQPMADVYIGMNLRGSKNRNHLNP